MKYIIGVDGGGTKTETVAYNLQGAAIATCLRGYGNVAMGYEGALRNIIDSIKHCRSVIGDGELSGIYLGIAGAEVGDYAMALEKKISEEFKVKAVVVNDGELALRALLEGEDGILAIAGTGSIAFGINGDKRARCGGWGHLLGDEGSGYGIAIEALKNMTKEADCSMEYSMLSVELLKQLKAASVDDILEFVYSSNKNKIASLAPIVSSCAEANDKAALHILQEEGRKLGETTYRVYKKLGFKTECKIAIVGSAIKKSKFLRGAFEEYLKSKIEGITFIDKDACSAKGACYMHLKATNN